MNLVNEVPLISTDFITVQQKHHRSSNTVQGVRPAPTPPAMSPPPPTLPNLAPSGTSGLPLSLPLATQVLPFTDAQVDDYREQDRWLPVCLILGSWDLESETDPADRKRLTDHEDGLTDLCKSIQRS